MSLYTESHDYFEKLTPESDEALVRLLAELRHLFGAVLVRSLSEGDRADLQAALDSYGLRAARIVESHYGGARCRAVLAADERAHEQSGEGK